MSAPIDVGMTRELAADLSAASLGLAQRFSAGATMWCIAPAFAPHAQHIAVEFVHPVIVGKPALAAVALTGADLVGQVRVSARAGDVVVAVAGAADPDVKEVMRRAAAWGVATIWIGHGERPGPGAADYVLWLDSDDATLAATGEFVVIYHLLWELTHVCLEHRGLVSPPESECTDDVCITCSDEGRPAEVLAGTTDGTLLVRTARGTETVMAVLDTPPQAGDLVLVHAGMVIATLSES